MIAGAMDTYRYTAIVQQSFCAAKALIRKEGRKEVNNYENLPLSTSLKYSHTLANENFITEIAWINEWV